METILKLECYERILRIDSNNEGVIISQLSKAIPGRRLEDEVIGIPKDELSEVINALVKIKEGK